VVSGGIRRNEMAVSEIPTTTASTAADPASPEAIRPFTFDV
jgi:hypothetical protein